ncbi:N-acetyltransferase [Rufibacter ruber]|uniref:GNAT family N-acetyltransferase n=1 Tax=Rufibacter ruber TaxID=1783499 RepID=UPI0009448E87
MVSLRIESSLYLTGRGMGKALVMAAVVYAREQNIKIHPVCPSPKCSSRKRNLLGMCCLRSGWLWGERRMLY